MLGVPQKQRFIAEKGEKPQAVINCSGILASLPVGEELQPDAWVSESPSHVPKVSLAIPSRLSESYGSWVCSSEAGSSELGAVGWT